MTVISDGSRSSIIAVDAADQAGHLERVADGHRAEAQALPGLVELDGERPVHVQVARGHRQVGRLEGTAAFLVDDVERADDPDVVDEIGEVAGAPAAIDVTDEGRPANRAKHEVRAAEADVAVGVPGVQLELRWRQRDERLDLGRIQPDVPAQPVHLAPAPWNASNARSPRTSIPISERIRSDARWIISTWSAVRISTGRNGLTNRRHGSWPSPGGRRRGRRRWPSWPAAGSGRASGPGSTGGSTRGS